MSPVTGMFSAVGTRAYGLASGALKNISDLFSRTASILGVSTSGHAWNTLRGTWTTDGSRATNTDTPSTNPLSVISFQPNVIESVDTFDGGVGLVFWATDASNWWASYPTYTQNPTTTCNASYVENGSNPPSGSCCSGVTTHAGATTCSSGYTENTSNPPAGNCCTGVTTHSGSTTCSGVSHCYSAGCTPSGSLCSGISESTSGGGTTCTGPVVHCYTNGCNPGGCGTISNNNSSYSLYYGTGSSDGIACYNDGGASWSGITGYCRFDSFDYYQNTNVTSPISYDRWASIYVTTATTYSCYTSNVTAASTYSCYTSTTTTYTYDTRIVVVSSVSGSVVTDSTTTLVSASSSLSPVASLKVVTSGNQITTTAYSSAGLVSQLGSPIVRTPASPARGASVGIIRATAGYNQGTQLDNFAATKN